jgi:diguanylate cyclase (GGDEF)-like protein/PAS domain S-box-containing protein/hemerythrin-like metal-binding protein
MNNAAKSMMSAPPVFTAEDEHRKIADLIDRLADARHQNSPESKANAVLVEALKFARSHALDEEAVMAAVGYPEINEHRVEHEKIIRDLSEFAARLQQNDVTAIQDAESLLRRWQNEHFAGSDRRFHAYLVAFLLHRLHVGFDGETRNAIAAQVEIERLRSIMEAAPNAILIADEAGMMYMVNSQVERLFGYSRAELLGKSVEMLVPERFRQPHARMRTGFSASPERRFMGAGRDLFGVRKDGVELPLEIGLGPLQTVEGRFVLASIIDISQRKAAEQVLRASEADALRDSMLRSLPASIIAADSDGKIVAINPAAERLLGYSPAELVGQPMVLIHNQEEIRRRSIEFSKHLGIEIPADFQVLVASGSRETADEREWTYYRKDGTQIPVHLAITTLRDSADKVIGFLTVANDISARKQAESAIRHMADHDALTGLPNRTLLADRMRMAMRLATRDQKQVAVLLLDLDQFKQVNDSLGHHVGDELLVAIAKRLQGCVREVDTVARLGGDEFVIVVTDVDDPQRLAPLIEQITQSVSLPLSLEGHELQITPSIGACLFPKDGNDAAILLRKADAAMYRAKAGGRGTYKWFNNAMMLESQEKLILGNALRHALERNEISLHFQPQVSLRTGHIVGIEALMRWRNGEEGDISPARFIPIAEDTGLIVSLGEWALRAACRRCVELQAQFGRMLTVAVNVSARQLNEKHWLKAVKSALADSGLSPSQLDLEITESVLMQHPEDGASLLDAIRELGVGVVIDDFGTGYSSLSYLTRFPIDAIKVDQSFVRDLTTDAKDAAIVNAIIAMARRLNVTVIAEGVETVDQQNHLVDEGCDEAQGYLYARGLPFDELLLKFEAIESAVVLDKSRTKTKFELANWVRRMESLQ